MTQRCVWADRSPLESTYHDEEWGVPSFDDAYLFELLVLESMQAGLSWTTIIQKRASMKAAFSNFVPQVIATYENADIDRLLQDPGIIRHRQKCEATVANAQAFLKIQEAYGSFADYLWEFVDHTPLVNHYNDVSEVPSQTDLSVFIAKDFKKRGFKFMGPTTVYAYMQAVGLVDDHMDGCFRKQES